MFVFEAFLCDVYSLVPVFVRETIVARKCVLFKKYKTFSVLIYSYINTSGNWKIKNNSKKNKITNKITNNKITLSLT